MADKKKIDGFGLIGILIVIAVIALASGGGLYWKEAQNQKNAIQVGLEAEKKARELVESLNKKQKDLGNEGIACTQEAKLCPDGSAVGRTGPNCEFASCPVDKTSGKSCNTDADCGSDESCLSLAPVVPVVPGYKKSFVCYPNNSSLPLPQ